MRTERDRQTGMTKLIVAFHNFAIARKDLRRIEQRNQAIKFVNKASDDENLLILQISNI